MLLLYLEFKGEKIISHLWSSKRAIWLAIFVFFFFGNEEFYSESLIGKLRIVPLLLTVMKSARLHSSSLSKAWPIEAERKGGRKHIIIHNRVGFL